MKKVKKVGVGTEFKFKRANGEVEIGRFTAKCRQKERSIVLMTGFDKNQRPLYQEIPWRKIKSIHIRPRKKIVVPADREDLVTLAMQKRYPKNFQPKVKGLQILKRDLVDREVEPVDKSFLSSWIRESNRKRKLGLIQKPAKSAKRRKPVKHGAYVLPRHAWLTELSSGCM